MLCHFLMFLFLNINIKFPEFLGEMMRNNKGLLKKNDDCFTMNLYIPLLAKIFKIFYNYILFRFNKIKNSKQISK